MKTTHISFLLVFLVLLSGTASFAQAPLWAFNIGSTTDDQSRVVRVAPNGNVLIAGKFTGTMDLDPGAGVHNITSNGNDDIFLSCYSSSGAFIWGFGIGGPLYDAVWNMTIDKNSNVIIVGYFQSAGINFSPLSGSFIMPFAGGAGLTYYGDGFVAKYSSAGAFMWGYDLGGTTVYDHAENATTDEAGNVYVSGEFSASMSLLGGPTLNTATDGEAYLIKYTSIGTLIWAHNYGLPGISASDCQAWALKYSNGSLYVAGTFQGTSNFDFWGTPAWLTSVGHYDSYIAKYDTNGNFNFVHPISGPGYAQELFCVALDDSNNMYVTGYTESPTMIFAYGTSLSVTAPGGGGNMDITMAKYDSNGIYKWGTILGGPGTDIGFWVDVIGDYVYFTGEFENTVNMATYGGTFNLTSSGGEDLYVTKYDHGGNFICGFSVGSPISDDIGYGLDHDTSGHLYVTGQFGGTAVDFDPTSGVYDLTSIGGTDAFLVKYNWVGDTVVTGYAVGDTICAGQTAHVTFVITSGPPGPYTITFTDGTSSYTLTGVLNGVPVTLTVSPAVTTTYTITSITTGTINICTGLAISGFGPFTVVVHPLPVVAITDSLIGCKKYLFAATSGDSIYAWSFGDSTNGFGNPVIHAYNNPGTFNVLLTVTSKFNCISNDAVTVVVDSGIKVNIGPDTFLCIGDSLMLKSALVYSAPVYLWNTGSVDSEILVKTSGAYWLQVTDSGCTGSDTLLATFIEPPVLDLAKDTTFCFGNPIKLYAPVLAGDSDLWSTGSTAGFITVNQSGTYWLRVGEKGCYTTDTIQVLMIMPPPGTNLTNVTPDETIKYGSSIQLNADNEKYYMWKPDDGSLNNPNINDPVATPYHTTQYTVYGYSQFGCLDSAMVTITVDSTMDECIPSAFTPNGDGLNDVFKPACITFQQLVDFRIYNRWGQMVFFTTSYKNGWDGTFNGTPQDMDTYYYMITVARPGNNVIYKGDVTLIR